MTMRRFIQSKPRLTGLLAVALLAMLASAVSFLVDTTYSNNFGMLTMSTDRRGMKFKFEPTARVNCDKIVFSQTSRVVFSNGGDIVVAFATISPALAFRDDDTLDDGTHIDHVSTTEDPYNNGDDRDDRQGSPGVKEDRGTPGKRNATENSPSEWTDYPYFPDGVFPAGKTNGRAEFEICAMCAEGAQAGTIYGCAKWEYSRTKGAANRGSSRATTAGVDLKPPSSKWQQAMALYEENHINEDGERFCPEEN